MTKIRKGKRATRAPIDKRSGMLASVGVAQTALYNGPVLAGVQVTPETSLGLTAVYAAIKVISETLASMPIPVYRRGPNDSREPDTSHRVYDLLNFEPNPEVTPFKFRQTLQAHTLGWGNGYAEIQRDNSGEPVALWNIHPNQVQPRRNDDGSLYYATINGNLPARDMLHIANLGTGDVLGLSPITIARETVGLSLGAEKYGAAFFGNSCQPNGFLQYAGGPMTPEATNNLRESVNRSHQGPGNAHKVALLPPGWNWVQTSMSSEDAEFLATRQFQVIEIARLFNLAPTKLQVWDKATYSNVQEANMDFYQSTMRPWAECWEDELNRKLFSPIDRRLYFAEHNMRSILRGRDVDRSTYYQSMFGMGVFSTNELRTLEGLNPIGPDGDKRLVPMNMETLAEAGEPDDQDLPPEAQPSADPAPTDTPVVQPDAPPVIEPVRAVLRDALKRMTTKEVNALRRIKGKAEPAREAWDFYQDHALTLAEAIEPALGVWNALGARSLDAGRIADRMVAGSLDAVLGALAGNRPTDSLADLLDQWAGGKADWLVDTITKEEA